jgi:hypothetical protein
LEALCLTYLASEEGRSPIVRDAELNRLHAGVLVRRHLSGHPEAQRAEPRGVQPVEYPKPEPSSRDRFNHGRPEAYRRAVEAGQGALSPNAG